MSRSQSVKTLRSSDYAHELDVLAALVFQKVNSLYRRSACCKHWVADDNKSLVYSIGKLAVILMWLVCDLCLRFAKACFDKAAVGLPKDFCDGERLRLLGNELTLTLVQADKYFSPKIEDGKLLIAVNKTSDRTYVKEQTTKFINDLTVAEITKSMQKMSASTGLVPEKVTIKPLTASWGRCISNRHISINSKLIVFRRECIDYVCLHELCHLVFMDHSKDFWALVGKFCPDWRGIREEMKG